MSAVPPEQYILEVSQDAPVTTTTSTINDVDLIIEVGTISADLSPLQPEVIEVPEYPPVGGGYDRVEVLPFTAQGPLTVIPNGSEFPIAGGNFRIESIAARVVQAPVGASIILDVLRNNTSIFNTTADRPTIASGTNNAVVGNYSGSILVPGDYLETIIVQVGSTNPGDTLTASIRLARVG